MVKELSVLIIKLNQFIMDKNPNFKKDVFEKKVEQHIKCGYSREIAEWKVLGDFNRRFFSLMGVKPNKRQTDKDGNYITELSNPTP